MPKIQVQNPGSSEIQSPLIAGITSGLSEISGVLDLGVGKLVDSPMVAVPVDGGAENKNRIYEIANGKRLWVLDPAPVFKKNGTVITQRSDNFSVDHIGGSITFQLQSKPSDSDKITVSCSYIYGDSKTITNILNDISTVQDKSGRYKGGFSNFKSLTETIPAAKKSDFAVVLEPPTVYVWNNAWKAAQAEIDLSDYSTTVEMNQELNKKEPVINKRSSSAESDNFFWGGRKTWIDLFSKVRGTVLTGLSTASSAVVTASDTVLSAIGKLQAQVAKSTERAFLKDTGAPTTGTVGIVGQRYVNSSNGDEYICTASSGSKYTWVPYTRTINGKSGKDITLSASDVGALGKSETASNSSKLGGNPASYYASASSVSKNTSAISANTSSISSNSKNISANTQNISTNTQSIKTNAENVKEFSATFSRTGWRGGNGAWTQTVTCSGMRQNYNTEGFSVRTTANKEDSAAMLEVGRILSEGHIVTLNGQIQATVYEQPQAGVTIYMRRSVIE